MRGLRNAVERMEEKMGKGQRHCPSCRIHARYKLFDPRSPVLRADDLLTYRCELCGGARFFNLTEYSEDEREIHRLDYSITIEDQCTDVVACAFKTWKLLYLRVELGRLGQARTRRSDGGEDSAARALRRLREEKSELILRKKRRIEAKYKEIDFPELRALIESTSEGVLRRRQEHLHIPGVRELMEEEGRFSVCAELEKIIWGRVRPLTASYVEHVGEQIAGLVEEEEERLRVEAEAKRLREEREAEEREAREKAEAQDALLLKSMDMNSGMHVLDYEAYCKQFVGGDPYNPRLPTYG